MFDVLVESTSRRRGARTWSFFFAASAFWLVVLTGVGIAGVMTYDARLDADFARITLVTQMPQQSPPPRLLPRTSQVNTGVVHALQAQSMQPTAIAPPRTIPVIGTTSFDATPAGEGDRHAGDWIGGTVPGTREIGGPNNHPAPPPEPVVEPVREQPATKPITVSRILSGIAIRKVEPPYPAIAKQTNTTGEVVVEVTVSEAGDVLAARVVSGHPLLREAALTASRQWRFSPTILGDKPVRVIGTITFVFRR